MTMPRATSRAATEMAAQETLPEVRLPLSFSTVAGQPAGTRDFSPWHHDETAAHAQGQRTIYANTMFLEAFLDRTALEWAGPTWMLAQRSMRMLGSAYAGTTLVGTGSVISVTLGDNGATVEVAVQASTEDGLCATARITLRDQMQPRTGREQS